MTECVLLCEVNASSHIDDTTRHDSMRHDPFFRFPYNQMDQFTHTLSLVHTYATRHDTTACDTTRFFASHTIKWISSHICSTTKSGRHDTELRQQKSLWKRFLSCVAPTLSRKPLKKTVFIGISPGFINL